MHCNFGSLPTAGLEHFGDVFSDLVGMMSESQLAELVERMPSSLPSGHGLPDLFDEVESWLNIRRVLVEVLTDNNEGSAIRRKRKNLHPAFHA